jgi:hypothetical protein
MYHVVKKGILENSITTSKESVPFATILPTQNRVVLTEARSIKSQMKFSPTPQIKFELNFPTTILFVLRYISSPSTFQLLLRCVIWYYEVRARGVALEFKLSHPQSTLI